MIIIDSNEFGEPIDSSYTQLWLNAHKFYNSSTQKIILFDNFAEYRDYMENNYPQTPPPVFTWDIPSNATVVDHLPNGLPVDEKWLQYPRFFRGDVLFIFNTIEEFDQYIAERTDYVDRG